jgi:hypothetical protein
MKALILTTEHIRSCDGRTYNPSIWDRNIDRMLNDYKDVVFYKVNKDNVYGYDRYFVEYTLPDGLRLFGRFEYSSSITSGGFYRLDKKPVTEDGETFYDLFLLLQDNDIEGYKELQDRLDKSNLLEITYGMFHDLETGEEHMIGTTKEARAWMTQRSLEFGLTFTKG